MIFLVARAVLAFVFFVLAQATASVAAPTSAWRPIDCGTFNLQASDPNLVTCGFVQAPRRHESPSGPSIQLAVAIIHSPDPKQGAEPLFLAQGGPGGSTIDSFGQVLIDDPATRPVRNRDLVLWDQRGTFFSRPNLTCPEVTKAALQSARQLREPEEVADRQSQLAYEACGARLTAEVGDLSAFNTVENADDVATIATALGYPRISFYGVSYGSELGQYVLRQHGALIRSAVLDGVVPTNFSLITSVPAVQARIAPKYFQACKADQHCNAAFPNLAERYAALIGRLNAKPVVLSIPGNASTSSFRTSLSGDDLSDAIYQGLYIRQARPLIPYVIDRAARGDYTLVSDFLVPLTLESGGTDATGMYMTVVCAERGDADLNAITNAGLGRSAVRAGVRDARDILTICRDWRIATLPRSVSEPVTSSVPTLLLSGAFDPITPPEFAQEVASHLSHHVAVTFPSGTHGQAFEDPCANGIIAAFVDDPAAAPPTACAANEPSRFITPRDLVIIPQLRSLVSVRGTSGLLAYVSGVRFLLPSLILLATAIPIYAVVETTALLLGRRRSPDLRSATGRYAAAAAWVAILAQFFFTATLVALAVGLGSSFVNNTLLTLVGAVPGSLRWLFVLPWVGILMVYLMGRATVALWQGHSRSLPGRLYYSLLFVAAIGVVIGFWRMGLLTALID